MSINSITAKKIYFEKYFSFDISTESTILTSFDFMFLFSCVQNWVLDTESSNDVRGFGVANFYS